MQQICRIPLPLLLLFVDMLQGLKMYFLMKPWGAACAEWVGADMDSPQRIRLRLTVAISLLCLFDLPLLEIVRAHHLHGGAHLEMTQPAKLRARHFVRA